MNFLLTALPLRRIIACVGIFHLILIHCLKAQTTTQIDSVIYALKTAAHDTTAARCYATLATLYFPARPDTVIPICNRLVEFVDQRLPKANKEERKAYLLSKSAALTNTGIVYYQHGEMEKAISYQLKGLKLAEETGAGAEIATDLNNLASYYYKLGNNAEALANFMKALKTQQQLNEKKGMAFTLNNIGSIYETQGQTKAALEYYFKGLKLQEEMKDKRGIGSCMNNIAALYMKQNELDKAIEYFNISLKARTEIDDKRGIGQCLNNMGNIFKMKGDKKKAKEYYERSITFFESVDFKQGVASAINNLATLCMLAGERQKALAYLKKSGEICENIQDKKGLSIAARNISTILLKEKKNAEALEYAERALQLAEEIKHVEMMRDANFALFQVDSARGKYNDALKHFRTYIVLRDSIVNEDTRKAGLKKQFQYEYEKKEEVAKLAQDKKDEIARQEHEKDLVVRNSLIAGFILILLLAILILKGYRNKRRANMVILLQKEEVEKAKEIIEMQKLAVEEKQKEILDSIKYARRIQASLMPPEKTVDKTLKRLRQSASH